MATGVVGPALFLVLSLLHGISSEDVTVHGFVGHGITLACDSSDTGTQVTWTKDDEVVASRWGTNTVYNDRNVELVSSTSGGMLYSLRLKSMMMSRKGTYKCNINTNKGSTTTIIKLIVHESPKIILPDVLLDGSDEASVACQTPKSVSLADMSWKLSNGTMRQQKNYLNKTLTAFLKPTREMHGQTLTCSVEFSGGVGKVEQSVVLDVKYLTLTIADSGGPHREGQESVNLTCKAEGNPMATSYSWTMPNSSRHWETMKAGMTIVFEDAISSNETGPYRCSATNGFVTASSPLYHLALEPDVDKGSWDKLVIYLGCLAGSALMLLIVVVVFVCRHKRPTNPYLDERDSTPIHKPAPPRRLPIPDEEENFGVGVVYSGPLPKPHPHGRSPRPQLRNPLAFSYLEAHNADADNISSTKTDPEDYDDVEVR
ncbi:nectin-4-like isoform X1 [Petromyzon marinus]|uniref:nectin-4-like isoform X1 n=1 Tax=Petromyzon marinus TaxID=7757 RepID=UPI003F727DAA